jgi:hypothetical protein
LQENIGGATQSFRCARRIGKVTRQLFESGPRFQTFSRLLQGIGSQPQRVIAERRVISNNCRVQEGGSAHEIPRIKADTSAQQASQTGGSAFGIISLDSSDHIFGRQ